VTKVKYYRPDLFSAYCTCRVTGALLKQGNKEVNNESLHAPKEHELVCPTYSTVLRLYNDIIRNEK
jgi:hypothetical protein